jgi:hypothetical protein
MTGLPPLLIETFSGIAMPAIICGVSTVTV